MSGEEDDAEKEHAPSQKRLDDARNRGDFARSQDLLSAAAMGGFVLATLALGTTALMKSGAAAMVMIDQSDRLAGMMQAGGRPVLAQALSAMTAPLLPLVLIPLVAALAYLFATQGVVFSGEKLAPKLSRISPIATAKQKFGLEGLFEFGKSAVKLGLISVALFYFLSLRAPDILNSHVLAPALATTLMLRLLVE
ncbi:MAG: EscU/YscU/HrcU family type III secretion system export apparatus switch protein, partial [Paracoccaceae bacterium]